MRDEEFFYGTEWTPAQLEILRRRGQKPMTAPTREEREQAAIGVLKPLEKPAIKARDDMPTAELSAEMITYLGPLQYRDAERQGFDMRYYRRVEPIPMMPCTCHPDDNPPNPCAGKYAYSDCVSATSKHARS